jgi:hypothetical protein
MTEQQPVFFVSNTERRNKFLTETRIWGKDATLYAEKRAVTVEATSHLEHMINTYVMLSGIKKLSNLVSIVAPEKTPQGNLKFTYIEGTSAERVLLEKVLIEDRQGAYEIIDKLFSLIDVLPSTNVNPVGNPSYVQVFGSAFDKEQICTKLGIIDLNLDNIIIDETGDWHLYDYEWAFDFPVPKQFLRMRFMWYFVSRHKETLRYHAQRIESVRIGKNIYVPAFLYDRYKKVFEKFKDLNIAESCFQLYVTGKESRHLPLIADAEFVVEKVGSPVVGIDSMIKLVESKAKKPIRKEVEKIREELQSERKLRISFEHRLNSVTSTKSFRLARKLSYIKRRLFSKNKG